MARATLTRQTATTLPPPGELARVPPHPPSPLRTPRRGPLQAALEGRGWSIVRPVLDLLLLCAAVVLALGGVRATLHVDALRAPLLALAPLVLSLLYLRGLYRTRLRPPILDALVPVLSAVSVGAMAVAMLGLFANGQAPPQSEGLRAWLFALLAVGLGRMCLSLVQLWARIHRLVERPVLIMGAGAVGAQVARWLEGHPEYGLAPVGFLDEDPLSIAAVGGRALPVLGSFENLDETVRRTGVKDLIVAFSSVADAHLSSLIRHCQEMGVRVSVVPRMFDAINNRVDYDTLGALPLMSFTRVDPKGVQFVLKHAFDRVFALVSLVVLSPVILCSALAVRLSSSGTVLFRQRRVGRDGREFDLYKFRSMRVDPEDVPSDEQAGPLDFLIGGDTAPGGVEGEDRRTAVGRFLRRTSLDELPQLVNVLRGEMSIIGPRPERPEFVELFRESIDRYADRHRVRSGITGWAQVHGSRGRTCLAERVAWDNYYIANWSLGLDLKILALTVVAVARKAE